MKATRIFAAILVCSLCSLGLFGAGGPAIKSYEEVLDLSGSSPRIAVSSQCVSDAQGVVYLPSRGKLAVTTIGVEGAGLLNGPGEDAKIDDLPCLKLLVDKAGSPVKVSIVYDAKEVLKAKDSKLGTTYPGGVSNYARTFANTAPLNIAAYSATMILPEGMDVYQVVKPAKAESYDLSSLDGKRTVVLKTAAVKAGAGSDISVDVYRQAGSTKTLVWVLVIGISLFMLFMRREILLGHPRTGQD